MGSAAPTWVAACVSQAGLALAALCGRAPTSAAAAVYAMMANAVANRHTMACRVRNVAQRALTDPRVVVRAVATVACVFQALATVNRVTLVTIAP